MSRNQTIKSQLSNYNTYLMYRRQLLSLAENVFEFENMPNYIDTAFLNKNLIRKGSIAFFVDEVLGLLALPYTILGNLDVYGRPIRIQAFGKNGYRKNLNQNEFVIMYDNNGRYPIYLDIIQYAERLALDTRVSDINIMQQRTPRIWKTRTDKVLSVQNILNNIDANVDSVLGYDDIDVDDTSAILQPAPFVADKVDTHKDKNWNEFLRLIGIANISYQKKERNISDEILAMQGGTIASRYSRFEPRKKAIEQINKLFKDSYLIDGSKVLEEEIKVKYYDGLPTSDKENEFETFEESEVEENDI